MNEYAKRDRQHVPDDFRGDVNAFIVPAHWRLYRASTWWRKLPSHDLPTADEAVVVLAGKRGVLRVVSRVPMEFEPPWVDTLRSEFVDPNDGNWLWWAPMSPPPD